MLASYINALSKHCTLQGRMHEVFDMRRYAKLPTHTHTQLCLLMLHTRTGNMHDVNGTRAWNFCPTKEGTQLPISCTQKHAPCAWSTTNYHAP
jgi:hypothetical protein